MKNLSVIFYSLLFIFLILSSCEKKEQHPVLDTFSITNISPSKFRVCANIVEKGNSPILDYGFVYILSSSEMERVTTESTTVSLGSVLNSDNFCTDITIPDLNQYPVNVRCNVSAYITNERGTVFANARNAEIMRLEITKVIPSSAKVNDTITIQGNNFESINLNSVKFNDVNGFIISSTPTELKVVVPQNIQLDYGEKFVDLHIVSGAQNWDLFESFTLAPSPMDFFPKHGNWLTNIKISGNALDSTMVYLNDLLLTKHKGSNTEIYVSLYFKSLFKKNKLYISKNGIKTEVPGGYFTIDEPQITSVTPKTCYPGSTISIKCENLNPVLEQNTLKLGEVSFSPTTRNFDYQFIIPSNMPAGEFRAFLNNGIDEIELPFPIKIAKPEITGISVTSGYISSIVTLTGKDFYEIPKIQFGSYTPYKAFYMDSTTVKFGVPGVTPGSYEVFADFAASRVKCTESFNVISPVVTAFSSLKGEPGTTLTISGEGFGYDNTAIYVRFVNNISINTSYILSTSDNQIDVQVPKWIYTGKYLIRISVNGYVISDSFYYEIP